MSNFLYFEIVAGGLVVFSVGYITGNLVEAWYSKRELEAAEPKGLDLDKLTDEQKRELLG